MYIENNKCTNKLTPDLIWTIRNENDVRKKNDSNNNEKNWACNNWAHIQHTFKRWTSHTKIERDEAKLRVSLMKTPRPFCAVVHQCRQWGTRERERERFILVCSHRNSSQQMVSYQCMWTLQQYAYKQIKPSICITKMVWWSLLSCKAHPWWFSVCALQNIRLMRALKNRRNVFNFTLPSNVQ